ncbi:hypothetical protein [Vulcanisaeta sp. JCM 16159]|uniref:hypothetical protein n=1 Tax=Vulcanisaeta sp. JCM 16159 TaxID=1295371 RepID=UPI0006D06CB8|nr:hypothetical protein [Vulcanisaeta sp. JCM 16159]
MAWSDDRSVILLMISLNELELPPYEIHRGPPVNSDAAEGFLKKYINEPSVIGPFIRGSRWFVIRRRKFSDITDAIRHIASMASLRHLRSSLNDAQYVKLKTFNDLEIFGPEERSIIEEFLWTRPWWLS